MNAFTQGDLPHSVQEILRELTAVRPNFQEIIRLGIKALEIGGLDPAITAFTHVVVGKAYKNTGDRLRARATLLKGYKLTLHLPEDQRDTLLLIEAGNALSLTFLALGEIAAARETLDTLRCQLIEYAWPTELPSAVLAHNTCRETLELRITLRQISD
jgi:hypothetical protein